MKSSEQSEDSEYDSEIDSEPKICMECPEQFTECGDLMEHSKEIHNI